MKFDYLIEKGLISLWNTKTQADFFLNPLIIVLLAILILLVVVGTKFKRYDALFSGLEYMIGGIILLFLCFAFRNIPSSGFIMVPAVISLIIGAGMLISLILFSVFLSINNLLKVISSMKLFSQVKRKARNNDKVNKFR